MTSFAAWWGAILSTLGFGLAGYVALRDRARLKILLQANVVVWSEAEARVWGKREYEAGKPYLLVTVANVGRRPVTIATVGFAQRGKLSDLILADSIRNDPTEIAEGKSAIYMERQEGFPFASVACVIVRDSAGRISKRRVPRMIRRMASPPSR